MTFPQRFSAALLAGGSSTRMGTDKAALVIDGEVLWRRQLAKLRATGADEVLISGRANGPYAGAECRIVEDRINAAGPLAGIDASLREAVHDWVVVLAVDLVDVPASFLSAITLNAMGANTGLIPTHADWFQPLAAIYPRQCLPIVEGCLDGADRSMRNFFQQAAARGVVKPWLLAENERGYFGNLNTPADLETRSETIHAGSE